MKLRWIRVSLIAIQGLLVALWLVNAARRLSQPHTSWSAVLDTPLLLTLVAVSTLAPSGLAAISEGRIRGRRLAVTSAVAVVVALVAFGVGFYASRGG